MSGSISKTGLGDVEVVHDEKRVESRRETLSSLTDDLEQSTSSEKESIKYDQHGLPLVPQPSRFRDDPLVRYHISTQFTMILTSDRTGLHG